MTDSRPAWTFLTNHGHVLLAVARDPNTLVQDLADDVGISTRSALTILKQLETSGYITRERVGRRTRYAVRRHQPFRHPTMADHEIDELLAVLR